MAADNSASNAQSRPVPLPVACLLGPDDAAVRREEWRWVAAQALVERSREPGSARLRFRTMAGVRRTLDDLVEAERKCCPFLTLALTEEGAEIVLSISGPPEADSVLDAFVPEQGS
jgi:hypothetical protein